MGVLPIVVQWPKKYLDMGNWGEVTLPIGVLFITGSGAHFVVVTSIPPFSAEAMGKKEFFPRKINMTGRKTHHE